MLHVIHTITGIQYYIYIYITVRQGQAPRLPGLPHGDYNNIILYN